MKLFNRVSCGENMFLWSCERLSYNFHFYYTAIGVTLIISILDLLVERIMRWRSRYKLSYFYGFACRYLQFLFILWFACIVLGKLYFV